MFVLCTRHNDEFVLLDRINGSTTAPSSVAR